MSEFVLSLSGPVMAGGGSRPLIDLGLSASATDLQMAWDVTGPAGATVGLSAGGRMPVVGPLPEPIDAPLRAHAEIRVGSQVIWEGFVRTRERGRGGVVTGLGLVGYAQSLADGWWSRPAPMVAEPLTTGGALRLALADLAPWMTPGVVGDQWIDPAIVHAAGVSDFARMTVAQMADQIRQQGDSQGRPVWVMCLPGRVVALWPQVTPTDPHYLIAFDLRIQRWQESDEGMASQVTVEHGTGSSGTLGTTGINAEFASSRGFGPHVLVTAGDIDSDAALALRNAELGRRSVPRVSATLAVTRDPATWLGNRHGTPTPWYEPRPGEWVGVAGEAPLPIIGTRVDANGGTATYELGQPDPNLPHRIDIIARDTAARYRQMIAANGGRLR